MSKKKITPAQFAYHIVLQSFTSHGNAREANWISVPEKTCVSYESNGASIAEEGHNVVTVKNPDDFIVVAGLWRDASCESHTFSVRKVFNSIDELSAYDMPFMKVDREEIEEGK